VSCSSNGGHLARPWTCESFMIRIMKCLSG
jgi:hypothetical protein